MSVAGVSCEHGMDDRACNTSSGVRRRRLYGWPAEA